MANIYELLELDIDPRPQFKTLDDIKKEITNKKRQLEAKARGASEAKNKQKISEIDEAAKDLTMEKFNAAYYEAKADIIQQLSELVKYVENNALSERKAKEYAKNYKVITPDFIYREFKLKKIIDDENKNSNKETLTLIEPQCKNINNTNKQYLKLLKKKNLYEFLNYEGKTGQESILQRKTPNELCKIADSLSGNFKGNEAVDSAGQKLITFCKTKIFVDSKSKEDYDYFINVYEPLTPIFIKLNKIIEGKTLTSRQGELLVEEINHVIKDVNKSKAYLRGKCEELKITWLETQDKTSTYCIFCGDKIKIEDEICGRCGKNQFVVCKCGQKNRANNKFCTSCASPFGDMKLVADYCDAAGGEIGALNFDVARKYIERAKDEGASESDLKKVNSYLESTEKEVKTKLNQLKRCEKDKKFYQADTIVKNLKKMYPSYSNPVLEMIIKDVLDKSKDLFEKAKKTSDINTKIENCAKIKSMCIDYPYVDNLIKDITLDAPYNVRVTTDDIRKSNTILWEYKALVDGIEFVVVRKEFSKPVNINDGKNIGRFSGRSCSDSEVEAGRQYYYSVFATLGDNYSRAGSNSDAVVNLFNVEKVSTQTGDNVIQLKWVYNGNGTIKLWRKENAIPSRAGDGIEVHNVNKDGFWDSDVVNGKSYGYYLYTEYKVGEKVLYSKGWSSTLITPEKPPQTVTYLFAEMNPVNKQVFKLEWEDIGENIKFYSSPKRLEWEANSLVSKQELELKAAQINVIVTAHGKGNVNIGGADELYITAVTMGERNCVIGANVYVSNKQIFNIKETRLIHEELHISLDGWPKGCKSLTVLYKNDGYAKSMSDKSAISLIYKPPMYRENNAVVIKQLAEDDYYISIFAELVNGKGYTPAVNVMYSNKQKVSIKYELEVSRSLIGKKVTNVKLIFKSSETFNLPDLYVYKNNGFLPPDMSVGERIKEIEAVSENKDIYSIDLGKDFRVNDYVRVFLKNSNASGNIQLEANSDLNI